jgi:hypothetical protein
MHKQKNPTVVFTSFILEKSFDPRKTQKARKNSNRYSIAGSHPKGE